MDIKKLALELQGPFLQAFKGDITLTRATEIASYNMMMAFLMDLMARAALKSAIAKFIFTGLIGNAFTWALTYLVKIAAKQGINFAENQLTGWHIGGLHTAYLANMQVYNGNIDVAEVVTEQMKVEYKANVKQELKKFFNLSRYFSNRK